MPHDDAHQLQPLLEGSLRGDPQAQNALLEKLRPFLQALLRSWL